MSRLLAKIMLAILMLPVGALAYVVAFSVLYETVLRRKEQECFVVSGLAAATFVAGYWLALWFRSVRWTRVRVLLSVATIPVGVGVGVALGLLLDDVERGLGSFLVGPTTTFAWLAMTVFIWRETTGERASRIDVRGSGALVCPACGYNMTGLGHSTCPECGAAYTITELIARQPGRDANDLEPARSAA